jgi:hypothetical protein
VGNGREDAQQSGEMMDKKLNLEIRHASDQSKKCFGWAQGMDISKEGKGE